MTYVDTKSIDELKEKLPKLILDVKKEYLELADHNFNQLTLFKQLFSFCFMPESLYFYHQGEKFSTGDDKLRLIELREIYHDALDVKHNFIAKNSKQPTIELDNLQMETFNRVTHFLN